MTLWNCGHDVPVSELEEHIKECALMTKLEQAFANDKSHVKEMSEN